MISNRELYDIFWNSQPESESDDLWALGKVRDAVIKDVLSIIDSLQRDGTDDSWMIRESIVQKYGVDL